MLDVNSIISSGGLLLIAFIVFAESGLLFGFFFPGDTLLFAAGIFAAQGDLPLFGTIAVIVVSAILGGRVGYYIGEKTGPRIFKKKDGIFFRHEYIAQAEKFYEKHGGKTIMLARFVPVVRTFAPVVAGAGKMDIAKFNLYNIVGSGVWAISITLAGYFLGSKIPNIDHYVLPIILFFVLLSFISPLFHAIKDPVTRARLLKKLGKKS